MKKPTVGARTGAPGDKGQQQQQKPPARRGRKLSEYGKQLNEKQQLKREYGMREKQFKRFFGIAEHSAGAPGENLLSLLERRLDNAVYRMKFVVTRRQSRQIIVHGHILVNGKKVYSPSYLVGINDVVSLADNVVSKEKFLEQVVDKRMAVAVKTPEWVEVDKVSRKGTVLRLPVRSDITTPVEEHLIVELYSK
ncbi:30S ribosomal protein S4 [bacterium]|jgi:small subunit ribosomal protein S4|nr:30S ribosomal protein S4 [bacterium]MBT3903970.1 30S ribosomal protein S4 [bacterium]MBT4577790.1 30S ribosomal protein S4 [bacterium]MBT5346089.1 30S ribosomal protein S4 [bacterium]MBT6131358.1 30S ribosomal protein S4 [bacterium]